MLEKAKKLRLPKSITISIKNRMLLNYNIVVIAINS